MNRSLIVEFRDSVCFRGADVCNQVEKFGCLSQARNEYERGLTVALHLADATARGI